MLLKNDTRIYWVVYVAVAILLFLALFIIAFNCIETKEDRRDQYNFIQLIR